MNRTIRRAHPQEPARSRALAARPGRLTSAGLVLLTLSAVLLLLWAAAAQASVWVIPAMSRAYPETKAGSRQSIAIDAAGNISAGTFYSFKYEKKLPTSGVPFTIQGSVSGLSIGVWKPITVTISNPNSVTIFVSALTVAVSTNSGSGGCDLSNFELQQSNVSTSLTVAVPADVDNFPLPAGVNAPQLLLKNLPVNQDECKGKSFTLTYSGTATN